MKPMRISKRGRVNEGRPMKYYRGLCDEILKYFDVGPVRESVVIVGGKNWQRTETKLLPGDFKSIEDFCWEHNIAPQRISEWCERHEEFAEAVSRVKREAKGKAGEGRSYGSL
jgi:hypothetical protein